MRNPNGPNREDQEAWADELRDQEERRAAHQCEGCGIVIPGNWNFCRRCLAEIERQNMASDKDTVTEAGWDAHGDTH